MAPPRGRRASKRKAPEPEVVIPVEGSPSPSPSSPPNLSPKNKGMSLGQKLFDRRATDALVDMSFILNDPEDGQQHLVPAHMLIVREGSSTLEEMIQRRKDKNKNNPPEIQVPSGAGATTFHTFLKFLYDLNTLQTPAQLKDDLLAKLLLLADHFAVQELYEKCCSILRERLNTENCVEIFQTTLPLTENELVKLAFQSILENLDTLLSPDNDEALLEWSWKTWQYLLPHLFGEQLVTAFKALKRWRDHDQAKRQEIFPRLGKCIRFRSFGSVAAADTLESTGILSQAEMVSLFMHFAGGQKTLTVEPSQDLQQTLNNCSPGSRIRLSSGSFDGVFVISNKGIKVIGSGPSTVIRGRLILDTDECEVGDLSLAVSEASFPPNDEGTALALTSGGDGISLILIKGNSNALTNLEILMEPKNGADEIQEQPSAKTKRRSRGKNVLEDKTTAKLKQTHTDFSRMSSIICTGNHNNLTNIITHLPTISITGDDNRLESLIFQSTSNGVVIEGDKNTVNDTMFFPSLVPSQSDAQCVTTGAALNIVFGRENVVTNLNVFQPPPNSEMLLLTTGPTSGNARVRNCTGGASVQIDGCNHDVVGVKLSPRFKFGVVGASHQLVDCSAEKLQNSGKNITITNCEFY